MYKLNYIVLFINWLSLDQQRFLIPEEQHSTNEYNMATNGSVYSEMIFKIFINICNINLTNIYIHNWYTY